MARLMREYGNDLGTTNSAICRMEKGKPVNSKSDTLKDTMPSCVSITKKKSIKVGDSAYNDLKSEKRRATKTWSKEKTNVFTEFKRTLATTTRHDSSYMEKSFTSEELSAEVLKALKSLVLDEDLTSIVITVPAKFTVNQTTATSEAAKLAGFKHCELLQEPIAAAMAYGLTTDSKNGIWMVFDFGGGTFDAALLKVEDGIMQVFDTEGDNYLGGKDLDYAIVDNIIIPYLLNNYSLSGVMSDADKKDILREAMKTYAEEIKIQLSFKEQEDIISNLGDLGEDENGEEIELDLTITQNEMFNTIRPYFQKAVDICKDLLVRNKLLPNQINKLILVGGPTHSPLIRQMLKEQITPNVDTSIDPMTAVSVGAALYASTLDAEVNESDLTAETIKLEVGYESTSVESSEWVSVKLSESAKLSHVLVELFRADKAWSSGKIEIDKVGNVIEAQLVESRPNSFEVVCYDNQGNRLPCFPNEITIIQSFKTGSAPLAYNIGIAAWSQDKECAVFRMAKGLEKNKTVPAVGFVDNLSITEKLRPGVKDDMLRIPVYQTEDFSEAEGRPVSLFEYVSDVIITGDEIDTLIPQNTPIDVTLKMDKSFRMMLEVRFLSTDTIVEKPLDTLKEQEAKEEEITQCFNDIHAGLHRLQQGGVKTKEIEQRLQQSKEEASNANVRDRKMVLQHLKEILRDIDRLDVGTEWQRLEKELREEFGRLEEAQRDLGNAQSGQKVEELRGLVDKAIRTKDVKVGREVLDQVHSLHVFLTLLYRCIGCIQHFDETFSSQQWKDATRARQLINQGLEAINDNPTVEKLHPIAVAIIKLLPDDCADTGGLPTTGEQEEQ